MHGLFDMIPFKIKIMEKPHTALLADLLFFKLQQNVLTFNDLYVRVGAPQGWSSDKIV